MRKIIIIGSYPSNERAENILNECVDRLSNHDYDLMIVSHYPVPDYIQKKVNYYIYDSENILTPKSMSPTFWYIDESLDVKVRTNAHNLTICKNIFNAINLSHSVGYDFFFYTECDNLIEYEDFEKLDKLQVSILETNKKMIFFKYKSECDIIAYDTLLFGGYIEYFKNELILPTTIQEYYDKSWFDTLEREFYNKLKSLEEDFLLIDFRLFEYLNNSKINEISNVIIPCEILINNLNDSFVLFIYNTLPREVNFIINSIDNIYSPGQWSYRFLDNSEKLNIIIEDGGLILSSNQIDISELNRDRISENGHLNFK